MFHRILSAWNRANLIKRISIGIVTGALLALIFPQASAISLLGQIFVGGLKAIAPMLVFTLVANALSQHQKGQKSNMKTVIILHYYEDLTLKQIAEITDTPLSTVKTRLYSALKKLKLILKEEEK